jgi:hypothetical protein
LNQTRINNSVFHLLNYIEKEKYKGFDPYDALNSPLFKLNFLRKNKFLRFSSQQFVKRFPVNIRSLLLITKGYNPVTLGLCLQAYGYLSMVFPERKEEFCNKANFLISELERLISEGFSGACWGYDFDWEARNASIPAYQPNIVATGIITNALFENYLLTRNQKTIELCLSSTNFVLKDLKRTYENELFCYSYSPFDSQKVLNASMKAVRLLVQVYLVTKDEQLLVNAKKAVSFVVNKQNNDGSWVYSDKENRIDNYHTGYVLDCLDAYVMLQMEKEFPNYYYCTN